MEKIVSNNNQNDIMNQQKDELNIIMKKQLFHFSKKINNIFIKIFKKELSCFLNTNVTLMCDNIKLYLYDDNHNQELLMYLNTIKIETCQSQSYISFSPNMLSIIIDLFFGGSGRNVNYIKKNINLHSSEYYINKIFIELIIKCYSYAYKDFSTIPMKFFHTALVTGMKKKYFNTTEKLILNIFKLTINHTSFYFNIFVPISFIKRLNQNINLINHSAKDSKKCISISLKDLYPVKLDVVVKLIACSIDRDNIPKISVGDVLPISNPENIIAYIENKPVFSGKYIDFNTRSSISIDNFIFNNSDAKK